jgi:hypothetical protein
MLAFVPVAFDVYRPLKPRLRWAMQCLLSFADCAGRCFPSVRKLAAFAGLSKSAVAPPFAWLRQESSKSGTCGNRQILKYRAFSAD